VAVVVPTRNREQLLGRLLRQLVALPEGLHYEVVVVDEGSSDGTPDLLAAFERDHSIVVVRHDEPKGLPGARNAGYQRSTAPYVAWIDDDDLTAPDRLALQHAALVGGLARWSCTGRIDIDDDLEVIGHVLCPSVARGGSAPPDRSAAGGISNRHGFDEHRHGSDGDHDRPGHRQASRRVRGRGGVARLGCDPPEPPDR